MMRISASARMRHPRAAIAVASLSVFAVLGAILVLAAGSSAASTASPVGLGTAGNFAVLAGAAITDVPTSSITGNVGVSPGTSDGVSCPEVHGTIFSPIGPLACGVTNPGLLTTATNDVYSPTGAYLNAKNRTPFTTLLGIPVPADNQLGGRTLVAGVYRLDHATTANLTGNVTLSGSATDVWIFQASTDLSFASGSTVHFSGGAQACNVFWQVGTLATIGSSANISGTILAGAGITAGTGATITGRLIAGTLVSLHQNTIIRPTCATAPGAQPPGRALYCAPNGQAYDLVQGENTQPPYDALNLIPAYVNPVTGSVSCTFPAAVTTTVAATTTTTTATPPPPPVAPPPTPKKASKPKRDVGVKAAKVVRIKHVPPKPAVHTSGFTG
jgi:hypothetical protein